MPETLPSQELISVSEIREGTLILKSGGLRKVLLASGVNFELKSSEEQEILLAGFQEFLASLDFSVQVVIHSRKINLDDYLAEIETLGEKEESELLKIQTQEYVNFVRSFLELYSVMDKKFFVAVPYEPVELSKEAVKGGVSKLLKRQAPTFTPALTEETFRRHHEQLLTRQEQVASGLSRIGIQAIPLETEELIELVHSLYNPTLREKRKLEPFPLSPEPRS